MITKFRLEARSLEKDGVSKELDNLVYSIIEILYANGRGHHPNMWEVSDDVISYNKNRKWYEGRRSVQAKESG